MSTSSRNGSDHYEAREGAMMERHPSEQDDEVCSAYAPKRTRERAAVERYSVENGDHLRLPYSPKMTRAQLADTSAFAVRSNAGLFSLVAAPENLQEHPERHAFHADEARPRPHVPPSGRYVSERPIPNKRDGRHYSLNTPFAEAAGANLSDTNEAASRQPDSTSGPHGQPAVRSDEIMIDRDLKRLEASLRSLQRKEVAARLPRAPQLGPVPGLASVDASSRHRGEMSGDRFRSSRSLQPERLAPPPAMPRRNVFAPFGILVGSVVVAAMAYYFAETGQALRSESAPGRQIVSLDPIAPLWSKDEHLSSPTLAQAGDHTSSMQSGISLKNTTPPQLAGASEGTIVAMLQPDEGDQPLRASRAARVLDTEKIKLLMKQGDEFIRAGDVVAARMVFQRAAQAGEADAAMAVGATYDPIILAKLAVVGVAPDGDKARAWYQRAESLGSGEATRRLAILANR